MEFEFSPHIAFQVNDYENAVDFYVNVLGFDIVKRHENEMDLKKGPMFFYCEKAESERTFTFFEFKVKDVASARDLLVSNGCEVTQEFSDKSIMISDPYGMKFHIWEDGADLS